MVCKLPLVVRGGTPETLFTFIYSAKRQIPTTLCLCFHIEFVSSNKLHLWTPKTLKPTTCSSIPRLCERKYLSIPPGGSNLVFTIKKEETCRLWSAVMPTVVIIKHVIGVFLTVCTLNWPKSYWPLCVILLYKHCCQCFSSYCTCLVKGRARLPFWVMFWLTPAEGFLYPSSSLQTAEPAAAQTSDSLDCLPTTSEALKVNMERW